MGRYSLLATWGGRVSNYVRGEDVYETSALVTFSGLRCGPWPVSRYIAYNLDHVHKCDPSFYVCACACLDRYQCAFTCVSV